MLTFKDISGVTRLEGTLSGDSIEVAELATPDVGSTASAENITIKAGDSATPGSGSGGDVTIQAGDGDSRGSVTIKDGDGDTALLVDGSKDVTLGVAGQETHIGDATGTLGFFGHSPAAQPAAPVLLGDVIAALQALGLVAT